MGEFYDARKEMPGWDAPGFDDSRWEPAIRGEDNGSVKAKFYEVQNPAPGGKWKRLKSCSIAWMKVTVSSVAPFLRSSV